MKSDTNVASEMPSVGRGYFLEQYNFGLVVEANKFEVTLRQYHTYMAPGWKIGELITIGLPEFVDQYRLGKFQDMNPEIRADLDAYLDETLNAINDLLGEDA